MLNEFCQCVDWKLIYGLNMLTRSGSAWNSTNAETLLNFTENRYQVHWELGNGMYHRREIGTRKCSLFNKIYCPQIFYISIVTIIFIQLSAANVKALFCFQFY